MMSRIRLISVTAAVLLTPALPASQDVGTVIEFSPQVTAQLQRYGDDEAATLRAAINTALARATGGVALPEGARITVTLQDVAPTHPTRKQLSDDPAQDIARTKFLGGAELAGSVQDASKHLVASVSYRHFAPTLGLGSASLDPWADARLAIDQFALKLAAACRARPPQPASHSGDAP
jgi:hypothetical protein